MNLPLVSIIIPFYNATDHLQKCLDSVIAQTYKNIELLLIDDGSTDNSSKIASEFCRSNSNWLVERSENKGPGNARNIGLSLCRGELILFVDSDDYMEPLMVQKMVRAISSSGAAIVLCGFRLFDDVQSEKFEKAWGFNAPSITGVDAIEGMYTGKLPVTVWAKIFRRECIQHLKFPTAMIYEDRPFMLAAFSNADNVLFLDEDLLHVCKRAGSLTRSPLNSKKVEDLTNIYKKEMALARKIHLNAILPFIRLYHLSWLRTSFFMLQTQELNSPKIKAVRPVLLAQINQFSSDNFLKLPWKSKVLIIVLRLPKWIGWTATRKLMGVLYPSRIL